jgi:RHS repeat-associated protein
VGPISEHTNARAHCSFQLGTTPEYGTTWLSVASSTDETGTVVQTLDYYPYGATRVSTGVNASSRKYIGQFADESNLSYLNARYMDPSRRQFLSEDPTFLALGNPNQLKQLVQQDQQKFLSDPQQLNSYSYAKGNPISNKDATGNGIVGEIGVEALHGVDARGLTYGATDYYYTTYGNPLAPMGQQIGKAIDVGIPVTLMVIPSLWPVGGVYGTWEAFVLSGEAITGRDPSEAPQYVAELKERAANGWKIPGYNFAPSLKPIGPGPSNGPVPGSSGSGSSNGQPQPQKNPSGGSVGGSSQSYYAQQIASIQAQIASIQAQINQYKASQNRYLLA